MSETIEQIRAALRRHCGGLDFSDEAALRRYWSLHSDDQRAEMLETIAKEAGNVESAAGTNDPT